MTLFSDALNNKFIGDLRYGNHDAGNPSITFLKGFDQNWNADMATLVTANGYATMGYTSTMPPVGTTNIEYVSWRSASDNVASSARRWKMYLQSNGVQPTNILDFVDTTNNVTQTTMNTLYPGQIVNMSAESVWTVTATPETFAFFGMKHNLDRTTNSYVFHYCGKLSNINTTYTYYNAPGPKNYWTQSIRLVGSGGTGNGNKIYGAHYIGNTFKTILNTGDADYPFVCSDAQTPTSTWITDYLVFDNDATLGYPVIGRCENLLVANTVIAPGRMVKISGVLPDGGSPWYIAVSPNHSQTRTILLRTYSTMT